MNSSKQQETAGNSTSTAIVSVVIAVCRRCLSPARQSAGGVQGGAEDGGLDRRRGVQVLPKSNGVPSREGLAWLESPSRQKTMRIRLNRAAQNRATEEQTIFSFLFSVLWLFCHFLGPCFVVLELKVPANAEGRFNWRGGTFCQRTYLLKNILLQRHFLRI